MNIIKRNRTPVYTGNAGTLSRWLDSFFGDRFFSDELTLNEWVPKVDIQDNDKELLVKADLPGIEEKDVSVEVENNVLTITGKREQEKEEKDGEYHRVERSFGSFTRSFTLPQSADTGKITAAYKNGVLTVAIPKSEKALPKKVHVKVS